MEIKFQGTENVLESLNTVSHKLDC